MIAARGLLAPSSDAPGEAGKVEHNCGGAGAGQAVDQRGVKRGVGRERRVLEQRVVLDGDDSDGVGRRSLSADGKAEIEQFGLQAIQPIERLSRAQQARDDERHDE